MDTIEEKVEVTRPSSLFANEELSSKAKVSPRVMSGPTNVHNQGAIDWGENGLLAFGCNYTVMVVDTRNIQHIQSLDKHKSMVNKVLWGLGQQKKLVSTDTSGQIIIWNIKSGNSIAVLQDGKNIVASMAWLSGHHDSDHLLLTLHPPYALILWDTQKYTKIWKKSYTETLVAFDLNPFELNKLAIQCSDCILFVEDLLPSKVPPSNGRKFYVSSPKPSSHIRSSSSGSLSAGVEEKHGTRDRLRRLMRDLVVGETKPKAEDSVPVMECLQLLHHRAVRDLLLLVYTSEILILDLHINHTVGLIPLDRSTSPLLQVVSARQRDILFCLHESGSVSVRAHRQPPVFVGSPLDAPTAATSSLDTGIVSGDSYLEVMYEQRCQSEVIRQTKGSKIIGVACSRICERRLALFVNTGRIVFLELQPSNTGTSSYLNLFNQPYGTQQSCVPKDTLSDLLPPLASETVSTPLRLLLMGLLPSVISPITAMKMNFCDIQKPVERLWSLAGPLMAVGTSNGLVQIINVATGSIEKEIAVSSYAIRGIEWINHFSILTWSHPNVSGSTATVRNELCICDISTGFIQQLRQDRGDESSIEIVRVSPLRFYFAVVLKDGTLEVWDLQNLTLLRNTKKFASIVALEWSPLIAKRSFRKKSVLYMKDERRTSQTSVPSTPVSADVVGAFGLSTELPSEIEEAGKENQIACERFVLIDGDNNFYHFLQDGNIARDGVKVLPESGKAATSCLAMKDEFIIQGDVEGNLFVWNLKSKQYSTIPTNRGGIKKMCFAPGTDNFKLLLLFNDGVLLLNPSESLTHAVELRCPRDMVTIVDIDWASDLCPLFATQDGCLRIMDSRLKHYCSSSIAEYEFQDHVSCIALLPKNVRKNLQVILATQYWEHDTDASTEDTPPSWMQCSTKNGFTDSQLLALHEQLSQIDNGILSALSINGATSGVAERCLLLSRIFGHQFNIDFWTVALHYLEVARSERKAGKKTGQIPDICSSGPGSSYVQDKKLSTSPKILPLDTCYDVLCDSQSYRHQQIDRVTMYESKRGDYQHTKRVIQELILLGETDRAVQLLLETELENPSYYTDAIKACLVATIQSTGAAQSTIKLVATNLIANGNIWEGVQLLCLIGKGLDACRYLMSYNLWTSAVWLAKSVLTGGEMNEVLKKWADYLLATGHKNQALLVILSMGNFERTLEILGSFRYHMHAGLLLQACREFGVLPQRSAMDIASPQAALLNAVELDFARFLFSTGNHHGGFSICRLLGESGLQLRRQFEILAEESM